MDRRNRRAESPLNICVFVAVLAFLTCCGTAFAQSASPFTFLFGRGSWDEGRSTYAPGPAEVPGPFGYLPSPDGYSSLPRDYDPYEYREAPVSPPPRTPVEVEKSIRAEPSPKEVMAATEAAKGGEGPLGPFLKDPTLRVGDIVVTTKGIMVFRGEEDAVHHATDFVSIANASGLVANKNTLISLEKASRLSPRDPLAFKSKRFTTEIVSSGSAKAAQSAAR